MPRKSERTRQAILDGAEEFLWSRPFRDLTVSQVTLLAGTGRSAFYQYFSDLYELMETLLNVTGEEIYAAARPWLKEDAVGGWQVKVTCSTHQGDFENNCWNLTSQGHLFYQSR